MRRIIANTTVENLPTKFHFSSRGAGIQEAGSAMANEPDFAELYNSFEIQYEQFLTDTNDEIAKSAQRLLELKSIVYGDSPAAELFVSMNSSSDAKNTKQDMTSALDFFFTRSS
jgi:hypothetical protein